MENNINAQDAVLESIMQDPSTVNWAATLLKPEEFRDPARRLIFETMVKLANEGKPIDYLHIHEALNDAGNWKNVGQEVFTVITDANPIPGEIRHYCAMVRRDMRRHRLVSLLDLLGKKLEANEGTEDCISTAIESLWKLMVDETKPDAKPLKEVMVEVLNQMSVERQCDGEVVGLPTGVHELDRATTGMRPSEFWVVGALPGRGKTAFGLQLAMAAATKHVPTMVFSMEMTREQVGRRFVASETTVGASGVRDPRIITEAKWTQMLESVAEFSGVPLYVDDSASLPLRELIARSRLYVRRHGVKLIIVDYLRLIQSPGRELREKLANAADQLRQLAKAENIVVVALSQLRRPGNLNDTPTMIDLKESGDIEAAANTVILLYQPIAEDGQPSGEDELIIGKQRNGPLGSIPVVFDKRTLTFKSRQAC